jgi:uncharacterized peroxidase-related enzyme
MKNRMTWIKTIHPATAVDELGKLYTRLLGPSGHIDNIMTAHSLRPHTLKGHMALYKHVLHHPRNTVPKWFLECVGVYTSMLNECEYCVAHHAAGMARLVGDESRSSAIVDALKAESWQGTFDDREAAALNYARLLTIAPNTLSNRDIVRLRDAGWVDGEILELNQVVSYFAYANRTVLGLGVDTDGDVLGLSPGGSGDADSWEHV